MEVSEHFAADALAFWEGRPAALTLFEALTRRLDADFPDIAAKVHKTQISFYRRHLFAMASRPRRREDALILSFGLGRPLTSPRIDASAEPYPGRWTHHAKLTGPAQLDGEALAWLREAWDFAARK